MAERYRSRTRTVLATQWFQHGDHVRVRKVAVDPNDHPEIKAHWDETSSGYLLGKRVRPGDFIVEEGDGRIYILAEDEFGKRFELEPEAHT